MNSETLSPVPGARGECETGPSAPHAPTERDILAAFRNALANCNLNVCVAIAKKYPSIKFPFVNLARRAILMAHITAFQCAIERGHFVAELADTMDWEHAGVFAAAVVGLFGGFESALMYACATQNEPMREWILGAANNERYKTKAALMTTAADAARRGVLSPAARVLLYRGIIAI